MAGLLPDPVPVEEGATVFQVGVIPADDWNRFCDRFEQNVPIRIVDRQRDDGGHPWQVSARWAPDLRRWELRVAAGLVNARHVEAPPIPLSRAPAATVTRLAGGNLAPSDLVAPWLTEDPWFPVEPRLWRKIGTDAVGSELESVPDFFAALGVDDGTGVAVDDFGLTTTQTALLPGRERRLLRALDVVLYQPRPALTAGLIDAGDGSTRLEANVFRSAARSEPAFVSLRSRFEPPFRAGTIPDLLAGLTDDPFDAIQLATVYLLSPDRAPDGSEPDQTWSSWVAHRVFKNLSHDVTVDLIPSATFGAVFIPLPLAGGIAQPIVDAIVEPTSRAAEEALALLNRSKIDGAFWT